MYVSWFSYFDGIPALTLAREHSARFTARRVFIHVRVCEFPSNLFGACPASVSRRRACLVAGCCFRILISDASATDDTLPLNKTVQRMSLSLTSYDGHLAGDALAPFDLFGAMAAHSLTFSLGHKSLACLRVPVFNFGVWPLAIPFSAVLPARCDLCRFITR
jgi:hypothetical protein